MATIEIILPAMGEGITDATITKIFKKIGENIEEDEALFEIATDKVDTEIPTPQSGNIAKIFYNEGDVVKIGSTIAIITTEGETISDKETIITDKIEIESNDTQLEEIKVEHKNYENQGVNKSSKNMFFSPLVKNIIAKENIDEKELSQIKGSGLNNRITKNDLLEFIKNKNIKKYNTNEKR